MANIVEEQMYSMTKIGSNNNKYWKIILRDDSTVEVEFGRIGYSGQSKVHDFGDMASASHFFKTKCSEKLKKGYVLQDVINTSSSTVKLESKNSLKDVAQEQIETNSDVVKKLLKYLAERNVHDILSSTTMSYNVESGLFSTPIGIVSKQSIDEARTVLIDLSTFVMKQDFKNAKYHGLLERYLTLIPQNVGMKLNPERIYRGSEDIEKQNSILDSLDASLISVKNSIANPTADVEVSTPKLFDLKLFLVEDQKIIDRVVKKFNSSVNRGHSCSHLKVKTVYSVEMPSTKKAFEPVAAKIGNVKELWHGTRVANVLSILKQGLVIPRSNAPHVCGRMFADGLYFSDQSTKSLNYAYGYWGGGARDNNCFMFIADVAMGKEYIPSGPSQNLPKPGYNSTFAVGGKSGVQNNEMIVYNLNQANLTYLIEFAP